MKYNYKSIKRMKDKDLRDEALTRLCLKRSKKKKPAKPLLSIQDETRTIAPREADYDYGCWQVSIFEAEGLSDDEIQEYVDGMRIEPAFPAWDCSGLAFTSYISWHRNPCGWISVVHRIGVDL